MLAIVKMIVVLSAICGIAGFGLSYLKLSTASRIEEQVMTYVQGPAILKVFTSIENSPIADRKKFTLPDGATIMVFPAKRGGKLIGVAIENFGKGYGGDVGIMVGFDTGRDTLVGIGVTTMKETPGLGSLIAEPRFSEQFTGKGLDVNLKAQGGSIDAISGATISSAGAVTAVANAAKLYTTLKAQIVQQWP